MPHLFAEPNENIQPGIKLNERYELISLAGHGRMGAVWKAKDLQEKRDLAIKFVPHDIQQFRNEMRRIRGMFDAAHSLNHPAICAAYSFEEDPVYGYYMVTEWIPAPTLEQYCSEAALPDGRIPQETALVILTSIAGALDYAHSQKVVHRDLKPTNIAVISDENGTVTGISLIDFGLAAEIRECSTRVTQSNIGSNEIPSYMPPEQWQSKRQDGRTDQYSLATIAYELLSGRLPFTGKNIDILRASILNDTPEKVSGLSAGANRALLKALAKTPEKRFASCSEFIAALSDPNWRSSEDKLKILISLGAGLVFGGVIYLLYRLFC